MINTVNPAVKATPQRQAPRAATPPRLVQVSANATTAPRKTPKPAEVQAAPRIPAPAQAASIPSAPPAAPAAKPAVTPPPAAIVAAAPKTAEPAANPSPQSAFMTRPAGATNAASKTGGAPLVLAPPRNSWESMVRVSLPQSSAATPTATEQPDQNAASEPPAEPATWSNLLTRLASAALGFISSFWTPAPPLSA